MVRETEEHHSRLNFNYSELGILERRLINDPDLIFTNSGEVIMFKEPCRSPEGIYLRVKRYGDDNMI